MRLFLLFSLAMVFVRCSLYDRALSKVTNYFINPTKHKST